MNPSPLRAALRMARRDALRHKWRSLLVVLLIGFPVFVLGCGDIAFRSWQLDPSERITREIGAADAAFQWQGGCSDLVQAPKAWLGDGLRCDGSGSPAQSSPPTATALLSRLPAGSRVIERIDAPGGARIRTAAGVKYADLQGFDYADPIVAGMVHQLEGRAPRNDNEIALTTALASSVGAHIGDALTMINARHTMTVVGIVRDARYRKIETAFSLPSAIDTSAGSAETTWYARTPVAVTWSQVLQFNRQSLVVLSREVYLSPPPKSQVPFYLQHGANHIPPQVIATVSLVAGMALLEVVLLAGPAFAVGARRQRRELALIGAVGGQTRDLRNVVLANGVVLGVIAGASAAIGAVLAGLIGVPTLGRFVDQIPGHTDIRPLELAGIACISLVTALLAAIFPAVQAARTDVVSALAGRRGSVRTRPHVPVIGVVVAALGAVVAIFGVTQSGNGSTVIVGGVVITEVGLIICTPSLLGVAARLGRLLPLAPRIALRDAGRNRSAATPAVAAVMASMIGAIGILIAVSSAQDQNKRNYVPRYPNHAVFAALPPAVLSGGATASPAQVQAALRATLPVDTSTVVRTADNAQDCTVTGNRKQCEVGGLVLLQNSRANSRFHGGGFPAVLVDDGSGVSTLFGRPEPAAAAALRAGRAVVPDTSALRAGDTVQLGVLDTSGNADPAQPTPIVGNPITLPAVVVGDGFAPAAVIVPPSAVHGIVTSQIVGVLATTTRMPTDAELQAARGRLDALMPNAFLDIETGYHNPAQWVLYLMVGIASIIALGAASIATALANTDGRDDLVTLGAVGASPRTRRVMSMSRAGVVAGLGCVIGVAAGFVPAYAWMRGDRRQLARSGNAALHFVVPWPPILIALFGVPVVAAVLAGLVTRSRLPSEQVRA